MRIIAGEARGKTLATPTDRTARPPLDRIRESVFAILADGFVNGNVIDLFSGVGAFGLEAVSRGARNATFVERDPRYAALIEENIARLSFDSRCTVLRGDALREPDLDVLQAGSVSLVLMDPPFDLFRGDSSGAAPVFERVQAIRENPAVAVDGRIVLRLPTKFYGDIPITPDDERRYGASRVLFLSSNHS